MCRIIVKYLLFSVNLICTIVGLALIGVGVAVLHQMDQLLTVVLIDLSFVPYLVIILGVVVFLIAFCGCCGAITESKGLLIIYAVFMAILAAVKIYVAVKLLNNLTTHKNTIEEYLNDTFTDPDTNQTFHVLEALFHCCGTTGPDSYEENDYNLVAPTCCENPSETTMCTRDEAFQSGCISVIGDAFDSITNIIGITLIVLIVTEVVAMASSILMIITVEPKNEY